MQPIIHPIFEPKTSAWQYIVACPQTKEAVIIDPVLDFEPSTFTVTTQAADQVLDIVKKQGYTVTGLLETHAHSDHLTAAYYMQQSLWVTGSPHASISIGENITAVQIAFAHKYNIPKAELENSFDHLFHDGEQFQIGEVTATVLNLPGHTPDHVGYHVEGCVFTGDSLFNPDVGTARCDFPGGDTRALWKSIRRILSLPSDTKLYTGHDYPPSNESGARDPLPYVTVKDQRQHNKHAKNGSTEEDFIQWRTQSDRVLGEPRLLHQAMQVNVRGGKMPARAQDGKALFQYVVNVPKTLLTG